MDINIPENFIMLHSVHLFLMRLSDQMLKKMPMKPLITQLFALSLLLFTSLSQGVEISKLDEAEVVVASRANDVKAKALGQALASVFLKNSGTPSVLAHPLVKMQLKQPDVLLVQYGYTEVNGELILTASFDHQRIINTLRQADLPVWGSQRPLTLFWLALDEGGDKVLLADSSVSELRQELELSSRNNGIPVLLPVLDLDDLMAVNVTDVRGMFVEPVSKASNRYQADYFTLVDFDKQGSHINFTLALYDKTRTNGVLMPLLRHQGQAADYQQAAKDVMEKLANYFVSQYAIAATGEGNETEVTFMGLGKMTQTVALESYLRQLSAVKNIKVSQIKGDSIRYQVELFGTVEDLQRLLNLDPRLNAIDSQGGVDAYYAPQSTSAQELLYQWRG
ncbi:conserved hypothetical protein [Shewanella denitrificans OS217]|jgi:uncharacterized protein|uniref:DUF2066 domain-containing protein n=2 Tax=Shewanella TaxID=22 RepID=Q12NQ0_SHEDO|nr:conserved hypothetical protein [Shewanella denitrificans OS217]